MTFNLFANFFCSRNGKIMVKKMHMNNMNNQLLTYSSM